MRKQKAQKMGGEIVGAKQVGNRGKFTKIQIGKIAHRAAIMTAVITVAMAGVCMGTKNTFAKNVLKTPPRYYANQLDDVIINKIVPNTGVVEATYDLISTEWTGDFRMINLLQVAFGSDPSDYELYMLDFNTRDGDTIVLNNRVNSMANWFNGEHVDVSKQFRNGGGNLLGNTTGRMYYLAGYSNMSYTYGRVDYSRCINSSVFRSGEATECWAEKIGDRKIQYQPYTATGERVEIPAEEDAELTALTDRFIYESGDWPAEYEWVEDESEGGNSEGGAGEGGADEGGAGEGGADEGGAGEGATGGSGENNTGNGGTGESDTSNTDNQSVNQGTEQAADQNANQDTGQTQDVANQSASQVANLTIATPTTPMELAIMDGDSSAGILGTEEVIVEIKVVDSENTENTESTDGQNRDNDEALLAANSSVADGDDVGVPELGKEFGDNKSWVIPVLVALSAVAAAISWWFLFFGKRKTNRERKEEK